MAKAKVGGTSAKLRGVVGDYIYQIVRNPAGYSEQKVITYTREKLNRNTKYQCLARMQITMFMNCMNLLTPIICDSFEGLRSRVNSCNRFVQINMPLVQDYCVRHWAESLACIWPRKGNGNATYFHFWISEGSYKIPQQFSWRFERRNGYRPIFDINLSRTFGRKIDLRKMFGISNNDCINFLFWENDGKTVLIVNTKLNPRFNDNTTINSANCKSLFVYTTTVLGTSGNNTYFVEPIVTWNQSTKLLSLKFVCKFKNSVGEFYIEPMFFSYIFSKRNGNLWLRNTNRFWVNNPDGDDSDFGEPPMDAYYDWDENYDGEDYNDYFVK